MKKNRKKELRNAFHKSYKGRPTILKGQTEAVYSNSFFHKFYHSYNERKQTLLGGNYYVIR